MKTTDELKYTRFNTGIIVGRFQVPELTEGHKALIQNVLDRHEKVFVLIGVVENNEVNEKNPLPFDCRLDMIQTTFPQVKVLGIMDEESDEDWVKSLDKTISMITSSLDTVTVYGSRDSFLNCYVQNGGTYPTSELVSDIHISGTELRNQILRNTINSADYRAGFISGVLIAMKNESERIKKAFGSI